MRYDPFFLLSGPVTLTFRPKECSTTLRVVMNMTYFCSSSERSPRCLFKRVTRARGQCPSNIYPPWIEIYIWAWLVEENVWAHKLGRYPTVLSWPGNASWSSWTQPKVPIMPPFFLLGRAVIPDGKKKASLTSLIWGTTDN